MFVPCDLIELLNLEQVSTVEPMVTETNYNHSHVSVQAVPVNVLQRQQPHGSDSALPPASLVFSLSPIIASGAGQPAQLTRGARAGPDASNSDGMLRPSVEAALLLGRPSYYTRSGLVYFSHQETEPLSTTPTTGLTSNPPAGSSSNNTRNAGTVACGSDGLVRLPRPDIEQISTTPTINPIFGHTAGPSSGIT